MKYRFNLNNSSLKNKRNIEMILRVQSAKDFNDFRFKSLIFINYLIVDILQLNFKGLLS